MLTFIEVVGGIFVASAVLTIVLQIALAFLRPSDGGLDAVGVGGSAASLFAGAVLLGLAEIIRTLRERH